MVGLRPAGPTAGQLNQPIICEYRSSAKLSGCRFENRGMTRRVFLAALPVSAIAVASAQDEYSGPRPAKKDVPYLLEADKLVETEVQQAKQSKSKEGQVLSVPGATSTARTPLPEPIFLLLSDKISADQLELYRFEVKDGRREVVIGKHKSDDEQDEFHLTVRKLDGALCRIEAAEMLDPGEYALAPEDGDTAFCFTVY